MNLMFRTYSLFLLLGLVNIYDTHPEVDNEFTSEGSEAPLHVDDDETGDHENFLKECYELAEDYRYDEAVACYTEAIENHPSQALYCYEQRGRFFSDMGKFQDALSDYKVAISLATDVERKGKYRIDYDGLAELGKRMCRKKTFEEAIWCFTEAVKGDPQEPSHFRLRGDCYIKMGNLDSAILDYKNVMRMDPHNKTIPLRLSEALYAADRPGEAVDVILVLDDAAISNLGMRLLSNHLEEYAIICFTEAIRKNPENGKYYEYRADCHLEMKNIEEAVSDFNEAIKRNPHNIRTRYFLIEALFRNKQINEALKETLVLNERELAELGRKQTSGCEFAPLIFTEAIKRNPSEASYYRFRGECYSRLNNPELAAVDFRECVKLDPNNKKDRLRLIESLLDSGKEKEAAAGFTRRVVSMRSYIVSNNEYNLFQEMVHLDLIDFSQLGLILRDKEKFEQAIFCYSIGITAALRPNQNVVVWTSIMYRERAGCYRELKKYEEAIMDYRNALKSSFSVSVQIQLCQLLMETGKYDEATEGLNYLQTEKFVHVLTSFNYKEITRIREEIMKRT